MSDGQSEQSGAEAGTAETPATEAGAADGAQPADDYEALKRRVAEAEAKLFKLREKRRQEEEAAAAAKAKAGEYEPLLEQLKSRVAELEPLEADAAAWRAYQEREAQSLAKRMKAAKLDDETVAALSAIPDLALRRSMLDRLTASGAPAPEHPAGSPSSPAGAKALKDMSAAEIEEARKRRNGSRVGRWL